MHKSALENCKLFFDNYKLDVDRPVVLDIGSFNYNGSCKDVVPKDYVYIGADFIDGPGVDIVLNDPYKLPFEENSFDFVVSSSTFEHSEHFWLLFIEILRVLKPKGLFYMNAPSSGKFHRYPVDCYRFYPDAGNALARFGQRLGVDCVSLESFIQLEDGSWSDFVCVFLKNRGYLQDFKCGIADKLQRDYVNILKIGSDDYKNYMPFQNRKRPLLKRALSYLRRAV